jgi:ABC-type branched-subunit amino acid transport system substrate-binding protein
MKKSTSLLTAVLVCGFTSSCSSTPVKKPAERVSASVEHEFRAAKTSADAGDSKKALPRLKKFIEQNPNTELTDDAYFLMGNMQYSQGKFQEAIASYNAILASETESQLENEAALRLARSYLKLNRYDEAERALERVQTGRGLANAVDPTIELEKIRFEIYSAQKKPLLALRSLVTLAEKHPVAADREKYRAQATDLLESQLSESDLREVSDEREYGFLQAPAKFRLALLMADQKNYSKARSLFADVTALVPGTDLGERAAGLVRQIDARSRVEGKTIGVVLPLSGKQATIGYRTLKGIQLGLGIFGRVPSNFRLAVIDSEGNPDVARKAIERLVVEDNVIAIIGGLLSKTVSAEASKAQELGVPTIMLSQKSSVTQTGDYIFRNGLTSEMQVEHLVDVSMNKLGMKNFAIMFPNDAYGVEFANLFWDEVSAHGGTITAAQPYDPKETDFRAPVQRLGGLFYTEDRADEYRQRLTAFNQKNPKRSARQSAPTMEEILPPVIDYDAIFIPDSARAVGLIAPMLAFNSISKVRLLGTNIWNSPAVISRGQRFVENSVFVDSILTSDRAFQSSPFFNEYKTLFEEDPSVVELQAYDSALLLRQLIGGGENTRVGLQQRLSSVQNFPGGMGPITVNSEREFRRSLSTLTIKDGKIGAFDLPHSTK